MARLAWLTQQATRRFHFAALAGTGARDGFLFALELAPSVILSLGIISVTEGLGGLRAAQQLMTPILRPILGIPGICSLALIANLQNTDAAAGMTKELAEEGVITEQERQFSPAGRQAAARF
ncbi:transporter [Citrobacter koseri]|nr:transporter [Citrobacter koseri]